MDWCIAWGKQPSRMWVNAQLASCFSLSTLLEATFRVRFPTCSTVWWDPWARSKRVAVVLSLSSTLYLSFFCVCAIPLIFWLLKCTMLAFVVVVFVLSQYIMFYILMLYMYMMYVWMYGLIHVVEFDPRSSGQTHTHRSGPDTGYESMNWWQTLKALHVPFCVRSLGWNRRGSSFEMGYLIVSFRPVRMGDWILVAPCLHFVTQVTNHAKCGLGQGNCNWVWGVSVPWRPVRTGRYSVEVKHRHPVTMRRASFLYERYD